MAAPTAKWGSPRDLDVLIYAQVSGYISGEPPVGIEPTTFSLRARFQRIDWVADMNRSVEPL
jgi:hypothetical protein